MGDVLPLYAPAPAPSTLREQNAFLREEVEESASHLAVMEEANTRLREQLRSLRQEVAALTEERDSAVRLLGAERLRTDALERRVAELERQLGEVLP